MSNPQVNIIIPLYNEEAVFTKLIERINRVLENTHLDVSVILVDDGSRDSTPFLLRELCESDSRYSGVLLSRNFGHQLALTAGMSVINATEAIFILDGDLQDPPELLDEFYSKIVEGNDVVYAIRKKRKENWFKRTAYKAFYRFLKRISYIDFPLDSGDFSMISRRVADFLNSMPEESRFVRGMRSWIGFNQIGIEYNRDEREAGDSKYTFKKLLKLALNGIFNFSEYPIKFITNTGIITILIGLIYFALVLLKKILWGNIPEGYTSLVFLIVLLGGIQLFSIGIIGEYVLRIFFQVKKRPLYIINQIITKKQ
jgi:glycosyltransferase involved in cell wall biosynthesis